MKNILFNKLRMNLNLAKKIVLPFILLQGGGEIYANYGGNNYYPEFYKYINYPTNFQFVNSFVPVTVIDSKFAPLPELNVIQSYYHTNYNAEDINYLNSLHGTAMASIIGANYFQQGDAYFSGLYPNVNLINRIAFPNLNSGTSIFEAASEAIFTEKEPIISISAGDKGVKNATEWNELLIKTGNNDKVLIITAVGNDGRDINLTLPNDQYWPAAYKPKRNKERLYDPVIRVAGLSYENNVPSFYRTRTGGSRYGAGRVDIGAPGHNISFLTADREIKIGNGTSEATAIVSSIVAIMRNCKPHASAKEIKDILLDTADRHDHLSTGITNGRVINAQKAIDRVCHQEAMQTESSMTYVYEAPEQDQQNMILYKNDLHTNEFSNIPVSWNITIANAGYHNYSLTDFSGLKNYQAKFGVAKANEEIAFYFTNAGQIVTTAGNRESLPLCLTASDPNSASWQNIGFRPCDNSLQDYQKWDLDFIPDQVHSYDSFVNFNLKLKSSNTCLRMKNNHFNWGSLFLSHCNEYDQENYLLKLKFTPSDHGRSIIQEVDLNYHKLKVGS